MTVNPPKILPLKIFSVLDPALGLQHVNKRNKPKKKKTRATPTIKENDGKRQKRKQGKKVREAGRTTSVNFPWTTDFMVLRHD